MSRTGTMNFNHEVRSLPGTTATSFKLKIRLYSHWIHSSGISDKQFTSEMNNVHPTTRNTPVRSAYSTLFSTDTSFSSIRLSCHVISLPTCTIGADRPTRNNRNGSHRLGSPAVCKRSCIKLNPGTRPCCQIS